MNIRDLIESGTLELYVMNALPDDERQEIESLASQNPEVKAEIAAIEAALEAYAQIRAVKPDADLKDNIVKNIDSTPQYSAPALKSAVTKPPLSYATIIATVAAIGFGILSFYFYKKNTDTEKNLKDCKTENIQIGEKQKVIAELQSKIDVLSNPQTKIIELKGLQIAPDSRVTVYWSKEKNTTLLTIQTLPPPPTGKQYQLWAIVNKKPVDAGMLTYDKNEIQNMKAFDNLEAFAITLEPTGGSINPTLDKMYVLGTL